ncbi:MAG: hypothetical protein H6R18_2215 [Proteobacteria bacterium]|nr:hypothetical protein [Pseudomonadota bacterium]
MALMCKVAASECPGQPMHGFNAKRYEAMRKAGLRLFASFELLPELLT